MKMAKASSTFCCTPDDYIQSTVCSEKINLTSLQQRKHLSSASSCNRGSYSVWLFWIDSRQNSHPSNSWTVLFHKKKAVKMNKAMVMPSALTATNHCRCSAPRWREKWFKNKPKTSSERFPSLWNASSASQAGIPKLQSSTMMRNQSSICWSGRCVKTAAPCFRGCSRVLIRRTEKSIGGHFSSRVWGHPANVNNKPNISTFNVSFPAPPGAIFIPDKRFIALKSFRPFLSHWWVSRRSVMLPLMSEGGKSCRGEQQRELLITWRRVRCTFGVQQPGYVCLTKWHSEIWIC